MRPAEGAGRSLAGDRTSAGLTQDDSAIIRLAQKIGNCINCGQRIRLIGGITTCATWMRWFSSFRIASQALREAM